MRHVHSTSGAPAGTRRARRTEERRRRHRRWAPRMLTAAAALAGWAIAATAATGGTYALWSDSETLGAGVIESGSAGLAVSGTLPTTAYSNLLPGERVAASVTLSNTGTAALALSAALSSPSAVFDVRVAVDAPACGTTALTTAPLTASAAGLASLPAGTARTLCVEVTALPAITPGAVVPFTIAVDGVQQ